MSGPARFARLPAAEQQAILGPGAYAAYQAGAIELEDVAGWSSAPDGGRTPRVKSLRELARTEEARKWRTRSRQADPPFVLTLHRVHKPGK